MGIVPRPRRNRRVRRDPEREAAFQRAERCFSWRLSHCCGCARVGDCTLLDPPPDPFIPYLVPTGAA
jgi:hypothetical protein